MDSSQVELHKDICLINRQVWAPLYKEKNVGSMVTRRIQVECVC